MSEAPILELTETTVPTRRDPDIAALSGVNWAVRPGEFWVVGGPMNSGKSDLMFLLAGLARPSRGAYRLFGHDMTQPLGDEFIPCRQRVGMVFDDARLFNHLTIAENVGLPARYHNDLHEDEVAAWVGALLRTTEVAEFTSNTPGMLARNWRRRVALARALALRPELLLLENPLRGLDALHASWWIEFLRQLWRGHDLMQGRATTIVVTADDLDPWHAGDMRFATLHGQTMVTTSHGASSDKAGTTKTEDN